MQGPGSLALTHAAANTYTGGTYFNAGTVSITNDNQLGTAPATAGVNLTFSGGTLSVANNVNLGANRNLLINPAGGTITMTGAAASVGGQITGPGASP